MTRIAIALLIALASGAASAQQPTPPDRFVDVPGDHWAYEAVENLRKQGIIVGYPDGRLRGKRTVTRYEAAVGLDRFVGAVERGRRRSSVPQSVMAGAKGARGAQGPAGSTGARRHHPEDVDRFRELVTLLNKEVTALRQELVSSERAIGEAERRIRK